MTPFQPSRHFFKFALVGAMGTLTDFFVTVMLVELAAFGVVVAGGGGFVAAATQNFFLNRSWTFSDHRGSSIQLQMVKFFSVSVIGLAIHTLFVMLVGSILQPFLAIVLELDAPSLDIDYRVTKAGAIGVVLLWNFIANKMWTFK